MSAVEISLRFPSNNIEATGIKLAIETELIWIMQPDGDGVVKATYQTTHEELEDLKSHLISCGVHPEAIIVG